MGSRVFDSLSEIARNVIPDETVCAKLHTVCREVDTLADTSRYIVVVSRNHQAMTSVSRVQQKFEKEECNTKDSNCDSKND
jgi:hypothetical protein